MRLVRFVASMFSLGCLLGSVGCTPDSSVDDIEASSDDAEALSLPLQVLDVTKSNAPSGLTILRKKSEYVAFFGAEPPAGVNFNQSWVVHYSIGVQNTGGYSVSFTSIDRIGSGASARLEVHTLDRTPGPNCAVTMALTNPQVTVKIPKQTKTIPVEQIFGLEVTDCGTVQNWCATALCAPGTTCDEFSDACVDDPFCPKVKCANGYECNEDLDACIGRLCDPDDSNSCPSGFVCENQIACITTPCPTEFRCEPAPEVTCDEIGWEGICHGPTLKYCDGDAMTVIDCAPGQCEFVEADGYYDCVP
ncbi:MAG: protease complex subunit PrcB family protein [Polyangiaceae bacterium]|nr:protease complex subunit PrcB family protein [Polyangiaceae bacterium]